MAALTDRVIIVGGGLVAFDGDLAALRARAGIPEEVVLTFRGDPHRIRLPLGDRSVPELVRVAAEWGDLVDVRVVEAGLDEVVAKVFREGGERR